MRKPHLNGRPKYNIGDIVIWAEKYSPELPDGPFVVTSIHLTDPKTDEYCTAISDYRTGEPMLKGCSSFFSWRFQQNAFLTQARKAVADAQSR